MSTRIRNTCSLLLTTVCALTAVQSHATTSSPPAPVPVLYDGRYYEVVLSSKITWQAAKAAAEQRTHDGIQGRLATIGSAEEDAFVQGLRQQVLPKGGELWAGGYQVPCVTTDPEPGCGWLWLNGEAIAATNTDSPYTNWLAGEPNNLIRGPDANTMASEDYLAIGKGTAAGWNDEGYLPNIRGYVIEYGDKVIVPATSCTGSGCNPTGAQILQYPDTAKVADDATLTARTFRFHDDPNRCGKEPLVLFGGAVVIPAYLCGHPDFLVIETDATGVEVPQGTILVENLTEDVLPGNLYGCTATRQNPVGQLDADPSHRDVVAWQSSDPADMLETTRGTGRFTGTVTEVTYGCGSSRGKVVYGSYHFVGLRIHPGIGNEFVDGNQSGNHKSFIDLTKYKLELLRTSVADSRASLPRLQYAALKVLIDATVLLHDQRRYKAALVSLRLFLYAVEHARYAPIAGQNFNGDHLMRGSNIEFIYKDKLLPFEP
ncbi:MAG TPA: hypothetical protein VIT67_14780 [Povalibacter sp.]